MILPFQAYGALGMARDNGEPDSGSSQFFFLKVGVGVYVYISLVVAAYHTIHHYLYVMRCIYIQWKQALNPPGRNTLDGFYSCFGYTHISYSYTYSIISLIIMTFLPRYVTSGNEDFLDQVTTNDKIEYMRVTSGLENLKRQTCIVYTSIYCIGVCVYYASRQTPLRLDNQRGGAGIEYEREIYRVVYVCYMID